MNTDWAALSAEVSEALAEQAARERREASELFATAYRMANPATA